MTKLMLFELQWQEKNNDLNRNESNNIVKFKTGKIPLVKASELFVIQKTKSETPVLRK